MIALRDTVTFIQARMSSERLPGKVMTDVHGRPLIAHVVARVSEAIPRERIVVATSVDPSDDALVEYLAAHGIQSFRGPLDNVASRIQQCLTRHPSPWFFRVCADSPLLDSTLFPRLGALAGQDVDIATNVFPRSFARGQSLELVNGATFQALDVAQLSGDQQEHVTKVFYDEPSRFRIVNLTAEPRERGIRNMAVDTADDLAALRQMYLERGSGS